MRFVRPLCALDDLIGGLAADTKSELLGPRDLLQNETVQARVIRSSANALAQELRRPGCDLPNFISRRTNWTSRQERNIYENFWAVHLTEGSLRNTLPLDGDINWPRALGYAQDVIVCGVLAELREEGLI